MAQRFVATIQGSFSNPAFDVTGEEECAGGKDEDALARAYIQRLRAVARSSAIVLTLIPHKLECRKLVTGIADALGLPFIDIAPVDFTSFDGGGHLDGAGARRFTTKFLAQLENLEAFKKLYRLLRRGSTLMLA